MATTTAKITKKPRLLLFYRRFFVGLLALAAVELVLNRIEIGLTARTFLMAESARGAGAADVTGSILAAGGTRDFSTTTARLKMGSDAPATEQAAAATTESSLSAPSSRPPPYAWCVINDGSASPNFEHFPHTMENLGPCWSYFTSVREAFSKQQQQQGSDVKCGIFLNSTRHHMSKVSPWSKQMLQAMNCTVVHDPPSRLLFKEHWHTTIASNSSIWFSKPSDADRLRDQVLGPWRRRRALDHRAIELRPRIGVIQRLPSKKRPDHNRIFLNIDEMVRAVRLEFSSATVELSNMSGYSMLEQARFWNDKDVMILAHGAAMTNVVFMEATSAVVEIFPDAYNPYEFFLGLMNSCRVRSYAIFENTTVRPRLTKGPRQADLHPNITDVVSLVRDALERKPPSPVRCVSLPGPKRCTKDLANQEQNYSYKLLRQDWLTSS
jgi:hypothetical protein